MALPTFNTKSPTVKRILKEASELSSHPDPTLHAAPLESNLFEWHFTIQGPPSTPYSDGIYHGRIILPPTYPLRPPSFRFLTPSGRFEVNREICLSISGHHEETWQPAWGIRTALWALRAFMEGDAKGQVGGMTMPEKERKRLAQESRSWQCTGCGGRSNETILREEGGERGESSEINRTIPEELKFGFRDEMTKVKDTDKASPTETSANAPVSTPTSSASSAMVESSASDAVAPAIVPSPTIPTAIAAPSHTPSPVTRISQPPPWIDKAITGVAAALAVMIVKKFVV